MASKANITRRRLIRWSALGALGGLIGARCARAQPAIKKASKQLANYIEKTPTSPQTCSKCHFFIDPDDCMVVEGPVDASGYCNYFTD
jgi:hypothetical protein